MKHTILSIGPIYETMKVADNTRAVWTVSFMFSYLMRETIEALRTEKKITNDEFVVPCINDEFEKYLKDGQRAGLFHDRLILKGCYADEINSAYEIAVEKLIAIIIETFKISEKQKYVKKSINTDKVKEYFQSYFQSYIASVDVPSGENPILALSAYVDAVEYEPRLALHEEYEYLHDFLRLTNLAGLQSVSFLEGSNSVTKDRCFKSLPEISAWELIEDQKDEWKKEHLCLKLSDAMNLKENIKNPEKEVDEIIKLLEKKFKVSNNDNEHKKIFKPYHKYVAVVQADGDGFGKYLEEIGSNEDKLKNFSTDIFKFASSASKIIESHGGSVVMAGGDDLLFFAPVVTKKMNVFTLIEEIDDAFKDIFKNNKNLSMSYGLSISYYKFPLQEAFDVAYKSLINHAKKATWMNTNKDVALREEDLGELPAKNAIQVNIRKHSGQSHSLTLPKDTTLFKEFITLLKNELDGNQNLHLPHSLHHALKKGAKVIDMIDSKSLNNFFTNQFDEDVHITKHEEALDAVIGILTTLKDGDEAQHLVVKDNKFYGTEHPSDVIFSMLSTIKLLRGDA